MLCAIIWKFIKDNGTSIAFLGPSIALILSIIWGVPKMFRKWKIKKMKTKIKNHMEKRRIFFKNDPRYNTIALKVEQLTKDFNSTTDIVGNALSELNHESVIIWDETNGEFYFKKDV